MTKNIYLAGGCFWGTEKTFKLLSGVTDTTVGYANGHSENPTYKEVCTDTTGHRETVKITYNPDKITLDQILTVYFMIIDPTVRNRQGADVGTQYQTGVYYDDPEDLPAIENRFKDERQKNAAFFVELCPLSCFYPAEEYHQDYLDKNPTGYCHVSVGEFHKIKELNEVWNS